MRSSNPGTPTGGWRLCCLLLLCACWLPLQAAANEADELYAERVVRSVYFEGVPQERALAISEAGSVRLVEMLADPQERAYHGNILMCLGIAGHPGSYEALSDYLAGLRAGGVERPEFRGWRLVPVAMGHLARHDGRALQWLISQLSSPSREDWSFLRHDLRQLRRRGAILGLGVSGRPEAADALNDYALRGVTRSAVTSAASRSALQREIGVALELHARVAARPPASHDTPQAER